MAEKKVGMIMLKHPPEHESPVMTGVVRFLSDWGVKVDVIYPEEQVIHLSKVRPAHDLYVLRSRTDMAMAFAGALHASGAAVLNPYPVSALLRDRVAAARTLMSAGVPIPETFVTAHPEQLTPFLEEGPLAIKPYRGTGTSGVHVVWDAEELDDVPTNRGPIYAQRFIALKERIRKVYVISGQVFGVEQHWPAYTYQEKVGEAFTITPRLREIALLCGKALGIEVFGLNIIGDEDEIYVVGAYSFPSFKGVPDAALRLADYIYHTCERVIQGEQVIRMTEGERKQ